MENDSSWSIQLYDPNSIVGRKREYDDIDTTLEHDHVDTTGLQLELMDVIKNSW